MAEKINLVVVRSDNTRQTVDGFLIAPGIAVFDDYGGWNVTHVRSGVAFCTWLDGKRQAAMLAKKLAALGNWDRPKSKLPKSLMKVGYKTCKEFPK